MFSKIAEAFTSLRVRLALIFSLGSLTTMAVATGYLTFAFEHETNGRNLRLVQGRLQEVAAILGSPRDSKESLEEEVLGELPASIPTPSTPRIQLRVLKRGEPLLESKEMQRFSPALFSARSKLRRHHRFFILAQRLEGDYLIQGALEVTEEELMIHNYRTRMFYVLWVGVGLCSLLGWWAAHRGLQPLRGIAASTRGITAQRLQQRLDPGQVPQELRDLVLALNAMLDRLNLAFERISRFSADLAHELRTPITNLMGETEVVLSRERPVEEYRQVLESSMDEFSRLSRLISRMLFLARAEDPGAAITPVPVEAQRLVDELLAFFEAAAEEQGVTLTGQGIGTLRGDPDLLRQALANLVSNALAATPEGGQITVRVSREASQAQLQVRDTGRGIAAEELPHVFDRFYRTGVALAHRAPGTGLGLALVQSIARLHGGDVQITSEPGKGTCVTLHFPV